MAKTAKNSVKLSSWEKTHLRQLALVDKKIAAAFDELCKKAGVIGALNAGKVSPDNAFSLSDYPDINKQIDNALRELSRSMQVAIVDGVRSQWSLANDKNDALCEQVLGSPRGKLPDALQKRYFAARNTEAVDAFIKRKEGGLNLSQRVWKYADEARVDIESALEIGIKSGQPASAIARDLKQYLKEPDKLFRRVRDKDGVLHLSSRAKEYHPGQGVYRSSYKNALRLAATECNMAYRESDYERWQQLDFVVGIEVKLSNNHTLNGHPFTDICDDLAGRYPKDFKFRGWHPFCRCHAVSILKTNEEIMADNKRILEGKEPLETSVNSVTEMPEGFKQWMEDNKDRILAADKHGTLPYFIKDNATTVATLADSPLKSVGAKPVLKVPTALEVATQRHAARTPEKIAAIKQAYYERNAIYHYGDNILAYMGGISDVSTSDLSSALASGNLNRILNEARKLKSIGKEILGYSRLDNPMQVAKSFSMAEAKTVNEAVKKKLAGWSGLSLEKQKSKLDFEIKWVETNKKYSTWQVAQSAYVKELARVEDAIDWEGIKSALKDAKAFKTKSKPYHEMLGKLDAAISSKNKSEAQSVISDIQAKRQALEKAAATRAKRKVKGVQFGDECFTDDRRNAAVWNRTAKEADDYFHENAVDFWAKLTADEKSGLWGYTAGSAYITEPLRAIPGHWYLYRSRYTQIQHDIDAMTTALQKQSFKKDTWIKRDSAPWNINYIFNIDLNKYKSNPAALVGKTGIEESFQSCGSCRETYFTATGPKDVIMNIYCPKGTKAAYTEPWSSCGTYDGGWDGKMKANPDKYSENEVLLQRGAIMRITKAEYTQGMWYIDVDVLGFEIKDYDLINDAAGIYCKFK